MKRLLNGCAYFPSSCSAIRQTAFADDVHTYVIQPGDTMLEIAARFGVAVDQLATANGMKWNAWVYAGQQLVIPAQAASPAAPAQPASENPLYATDLGCRILYPRYRYCRERCRRASRP